MCDDQRDSEDAALAHQQQLEHQEFIELSSGEKVDREEYQYETWDLQKKVEWYVDSYGENEFRKLLKDMGIWTYLTALA